MIQSIGGKSPRIHSDAWVHPSAVIIGDVTIGARTSIWPQVTIRADEGPVIIGDDSNIQDGTTIHMTGGVSTVAVGHRVTVGHNCILHGCNIKDDILIGMGSIVMDNAIVNSGAFVAAATLITGGKAVPPKMFVLGNPMKLVRPINEREKNWISYSWRHYGENALRYQKSET